MSLTIEAGKTYCHFRFATKTIPELNEYRQIFYPDGKKVVPHNILELLIEPLSLAVWYMDDGHKRTDCSALRLNTQSYSVGEQVMLQDCLLKNFGVRVNIHRMTERMCVLYVPSSEAQKFCNLIIGHM